MTAVHLQQWIEHPETLNRDTLYELRTLVVRYPYFQSLRLLYLKNLYLLHDINFGAELRKAALYVSDRRLLFYFIEGIRYTLTPQAVSPAKETLSSAESEEEPGLDRTLTLIDAFLATIPEDFTRNELDYATDYTAYLLKEEGQENPDEDTSAETAFSDSPLLRGQELIDGFIRQNSEPLPRRMEEEPATNPVNENFETDDSCFTETLARIYVKQHRYEKALEIIKKLSLNYPKKNSYFADQIRFLEKLIINAKSK